MLQAALSCKSSKRVGANKTNLTVLVLSGRIFARYLPFSAKINIAVVAQFSVMLPEPNILYHLYTLLPIALYNCTKGNAENTKIKIVLM